MKGKKGDISILRWIAFFALGISALVIVYLVFTGGLKSIATFFTGDHCEPATGEKCDEKACNTYNNLEWDSINNKCVPIKEVT